MHSRMCTGLHYHTFFSPTVGNRLLLKYIGLYK
uniref:Uncharacterized protein n=1 Tax=Anguilla anguilla TaxID=7936 RepID=A0A0E9PJH4_ANGAN